MNKIEINKLPELPWEVNEAVNQLRVNLSFCGSNVKTVMVTSSTPNEGKSFVTLQLWKAIAAMGTRVLHIDCDFRKSVLRTRYGFSTDGHMKGAAHYLAGQAALEDVVYETNIPNGYIIPVAKTIANPSILLESPRFAEMIAECRKHFDMILIDTPPLGSVSDALNIATHCDGTVLIAMCGQTPRKLVGNAVQQLKRTGTPLLGIVLNGAKTNGSNLYYKKYYGKSGYYYGGGTALAAEKNVSD